MDLFKNISWKNLMGGIGVGLILYFAAAQYFSDIRDTLFEKYGQYSVGLTEGAIIAVAATITAFYIASFINPEKYKVTNDKKDNDGKDSVEKQLIKIDQDIENLITERSRYLTKQTDSDRPINLLNDRIEKLREERRKLEESKK